MVNPVFSRLTHQQDEFLVRPMLSMLLSTFAVGAVFAVVEGGTFQYILSGPVDFFALLLAWALTYISPIAIAIIGSELTSRDARTETYRLMCTTTIKDGDIVKGYFLAALYRARIVFCLAGVLLPTIAAAMLRSKLLAGIDCTGNSDFYQLCPNAVPPSITEWIGWALASISLIVGFLGVNSAAASAGVAMGLWCRRRIMSIFLAPVLLAIAAIPVLTALVSPFNEENVLLKSNLPSITAFSHVLPSTIFGALLPYLLTMAILRIAQIQARRAS